MTLYHLEAALHAIIALLGYGAIALYIAPRFTAEGSVGWQVVVKASAVTFFIGCAIHHLMMAHHLLADPAPWMIGWDHILVEVMQAVAAPLFLVSAAQLGELKIRGVG